MNKLNRLIRSIGFCLVFSFTLAGCQQVVPVQQPHQPDAEILRVGVTPNAPPLIYKQNNAITGLEASFAHGLGAYLGKKVQFVEVPWGKQIEYLNDEKTDIIMSGMTITENRTFAVDFTKPYMRSGQILLVRLQDRQRFATGITSIMNTNYRIATVKGTISDLFVDSTIVRANKTAFRSPADAVDALISKKVDAFLYDAPIICFYAAQHQADELVPILTMATEEYLGWAVRKGNKQLLDKSNEFIESLEQNGMLMQEIKHWIPYLYR